LSLSADFYSDGQKPPIDHTIDHMLIPPLMFKVPGECKYLIGQNNVGQNFRHLEKFRHFCPVKQPGDASFLRQDFRHLREIPTSFFPIR